MNKTSSVAHFTSPHKQHRDTVPLQPVQSPSRTTSTHQSIPSTQHITECLQKQRRSPPPPERRLLARRPQRRRRPERRLLLPPETRRNEPRPERRHILLTSTKVLSCCCVDACWCWLCFLCVSKAESASERGDVFSPWCMDLGLFASCHLSFITCTTQVDASITYSCFCCVVSVFACLRDLGRDKASQSQVCLPFPSLMGHQHPSKIVITYRCIHQTFICVFPFRITSCIFLALLAQYADSPL